MRQWSSPVRGPVTSDLYANYLPRLLPALTALRADPSRRLTVPQAATACGLARSQFSLLFRRVTGLSYGQFCLHARLVQAARELAASDRPIERLAVELGFTDASHLHRQFVKQYACTPAEYRRRFRS